MHDKNRLKIAIERMHEIVAKMPPNKETKELLDILQKMTKEFIKLK